MTLINENYANLQSSYLFANIARKVAEFQKTHPDADIIRLGEQLGVDYARTVTCYAADSQGRACGVCDACRLRRKGFEEADLVDMTRYSHVE